MMGSKLVFLKSKTFFILCVISILAFCLRILSYPKVVVDGTLHLIGYDPYYHMRRILFTVDHFPDSITFDTYLNYPYGLEIGWPALYDQVAALLALIIGLGSPDRYTVEMTTAFFPVILGILSFIPLYIVALKLFNRDTALLSVGLLAILPIHIKHSLFGFPDHHIAEILLSTTVFAFFITSLKSPQNTSRYLVYAAFAGIFLSISLLTWTGSPIFFGIIAIYGVIQFTLDLKKNRPSQYLIKILTVTYLASLILVIPFVIKTVQSGMEMNLWYISWIHVLSIIIIIVLVLLLGFLSYFMHVRNITWWYYPAVVTALGMAGIILTREVLPSYYQLLVSGFSYLFDSELVIRTIAEAQPLFFEQNTFKLSPVWYGSAFCFFITIFAYILYIKDVITKNYTSEMVFFMIWTLIILLLTLSQRRFLYLFSINISILTSYIIIIGSNRLMNNNNNNTRKVPIKKNKTTKHKQTSNLSPIQIAGIAAIFLIVVFPNIYVSISASNHIKIPPSDWEESLVWLKDNTPVTSYYEDPSRTPEYGIMSWWDLGNWIMYIAQRPVVTNNFQVGLYDAARFFIESDESGARSILDARKVGYVITEDRMIIKKLGSIILLAGKEPSNYCTTQVNEHDNLVTTSVDVKDTLKQTMLWKLHVDDGSNLGSFRLIYESKTTRTQSPPVKFVKIFEYVNGANIIGFASPDEIVATYTNVTTNQNRTFIYFNVAKANETGWFSITVPYSNHGTPYDTQSMGSYTIIGLENNITKSVIISEEDVIDAVNIRVDLTDEYLATI